MLPWIHEHLCDYARQNNQYSSFCIGSAPIPNGGGGGGASKNDNGVGAGTTGDYSHSVPNQVNPPETGHSIRLDIQYDANPTEVAWILVETNEDKIVDYIPYGQATTPKEEISVVYENQPSGNYTFMVTDVGGDGICCNAGMGYIILSELSPDGSSSSLIWANNGDYGVGTYKNFELTDATLASRSAASTSTTKGRRPPY